eukprot:TRINITY_DN2885_c1_g2::TRINITY_DN2885_c1_g2_i1::g.5408::m.5408 TRINITY_DN2885_c1_g2::TRINITY_DN2885_c1_g2_i1::g.5408  ORF type:complete len:515 (-),score=51.74,sp/P00687/AMY1_MOUSE/49.90/1e-156,Alpha-amylase/PF00128.19/2e-20,Alpha-amylase_C/PF02806.13/6.9e-09 TRINITY_DN2885_c1_g2_i1:344-1888(-)
MIYLAQILLVLLPLGTCFPIIPTPLRPKVTDSYGSSTYVHLFEWKWTDIAKECENFLAPNGYKGVQVSPPNEHRVVNDPPYPWWQRYQPVSYILGSRSGNRDEFTSMVQRCRGVGVEIYVDAVINHMAADGSGVGSAGTPWDANNLKFKDYSSLDFHSCNGCSQYCNIGSYQDRYQVQYCRLSGLRDLETEDRNYVAPKIASYLNDLLSLGVAGFRIDAAKHMDANHLSYLLSLLHNTVDGKRPFIFHEVIDLGGEPISYKEYTSTGRVTEFRYGIDVSQAIRGISGKKLKDLQYVGKSLLDSAVSMAFIDNHDNQRGHGAGGKDLVTFWMPREYTIANIFMLAWPYGFTQVMSSYYWPRNIQSDGSDKNDWMGPLSTSDGKTSDIKCDANLWICEHRWPAIAAMVRFRAVSGSEPVVNWWDNGNDEICFGRGNKAFVAINNHSRVITRTYKTSLPVGTYCNVLDGVLQSNCNGTSTSCCTGQSVKVLSEGWTESVTVGQRNVTGFALHTGAMF